LGCRELEIVLLLVKRSQPVQPAEKRRASQRKVVDEEREPARIDGGQSLADPSSRPDNGGMKTGAPKKSAKT
jgi:hypothetical protein